MNKEHITRPLNYLKLRIAELWNRPYHQEIVQLMLDLPKDAFIGPERYYLEELLAQNTRLSSRQTAILNSIIDRLIA